METFNKYFEEVPSKLAGNIINNFHDNHCHLHIDKIKRNPHSAFFAPLTTLKLLTT